MKNRDHVEKMYKLYKDKFKDLEYKFELEKAKIEKESERARLKAYRQYVSLCEEQDLKPMQYNEFKKDLLKIEENVKNALITAQLFGGSVMEMRKNAIN